MSAIQLSDTRSCSAVAYREIDSVFVLACTPALSGNQLIFVNATTLSIIQRVDWIVLQPDDFLLDVAINQTTGNVVAVGSAFTGGKQNATVSLVSRNGSVISTRSFGGSGGSQTSNAVSINPINGDIYIAGSASGLIDSAQIVQVNGGNSTNLFIAKFTADASSMVWVKQFGNSAGSDSVSSVVAASDTVFVGGDINQGLYNIGFINAFYANNGDVRWNQSSFHSSSSLGQSIVHLQLDGNDLYAGGYYRGALYSLTAAVESPFILRLSANTGAIDSTWRYQTNETSTTQLSTFYVDTSLNKISFAGKASTFYPSDFIKVVSMNGALVNSSIVESNGFIKQIALDSMQQKMLVVGVNLVTSKGYFAEINYADFISGPTVTSTSSIPLETSTSVPVTTTTTTTQATTTTSVTITTTVSSASSSSGSSVASTTLSDTAVQPSATSYAASQSPLPFESNLASASSAEATSTSMILLQTTSSLTNSVQVSQVQSTINVLESASTSSFVKVTTSSGNSRSQVSSSVNAVNAQSSYNQVVFLTNSIQNFKSSLTSTGTIINGVQDQQQANGFNSTIWIAAGAGGLVFVVVCFVVVLLACRRKSSGRKQFMKQFQNVSSASYIGQDATGFTVQNTSSSEATTVSKALADRTTLTFNSTQMNTTWMSGTTWLRTEAEIAIPGYLKFQYLIDFKPGRLIAAGGSGLIYVCQLVNTELQQRANNVSTIVKVMQDQNTEGQMSAFYQELSLLWYFRDNPYIAKMIAFASAPPCIVMKHYKSGSLVDVLSGKSDVCRYVNGRSVAGYLKIIKDVSLGLQAIHLAQIAHCDMKSGNILIEFDNYYGVSAVITDFGLSRIIDPQSMLVREFVVSKLKGGSFAYAAPEVYLMLDQSTFTVSNLSKRPNGTLVKASDVYAFSIVIYECLHRKLAWR
ncbi:hypothetical protein MP228_004263 [Amoeboaphelidium protococcarum]|nr:hypothetical protein MP228_004263 [Amoeboaphelidium protococcarum]